MTKQRWLVRLGTQLGVTKREHHHELDAVREVVQRFYSRPGYVDNGSGGKRWHPGGHWPFGHDRLAEIAQAWPLTPEREAAYQQLVAENSTKARRAARESLRAARHDDLAIAA